ncbi:CCNL [Mytilus coruscus]|uniref:CCNL n=1 Tax=Mytilus coruscus TaxID=42192 RepID=A0A6J8BNC0_MYTCO|nr:CCNL [Mytilus coruscus]
MAEEKPNPLTIRDFSKVILTLETVLIPDDKLSPTPSLQDGLDSDTEMDLRILGCELIQSSGVLLKLPQVAMATGQVLFQRFYYSKSFVKHNMEVLAMACINLAAKIEESPRRIRDVINVFHHVKQMRKQKTIVPLILDQNYINLKNQVIKAERRVLKELGFSVHVKHPHKVIVVYLKLLEVEQNQKTGMQCAWRQKRHLNSLDRKDRGICCAFYVLYNYYLIFKFPVQYLYLDPGWKWNYMNDSFRTNVFVRFLPESIACACIYLAARQLQIALPDRPSWYSIFNVREDDIQEICLTILRLYARQRPNVEELGAKVMEAKRIQMENKKKSKGMTSDYGTPNSTSRANSPKNVSPNPTLLGSIKQLKLKKEKDDNTRKPDGGLIKNGSKRRRSHSFSPDKRSSGSSLSPPRSPISKKKKHKDIDSRRIKKENADYYKGSKLSHKRKKQISRSFSRSLSRSPERQYNKSSHNKKYYKDKYDHKDRYNDYKDRNDYKDKDRYEYSPDYRYVKRHRNGHRSSSPEAI